MLITTVLLAGLAGPAAGAVSAGCMSNGGGLPGGAAALAGGKAGTGDPGATTREGAVDSSCQATERSASHDCGHWVRWEAQVEFEGTSGAAKGEMGCEGSPTATCEVSTDDVACSIGNPDEDDGRLICDIGVVESGDFWAQIECEDPLVPFWFVRTTIHVVDGVVQERERVTGSLPAHAPASALTAGS